MTTRTVNLSILVFLWLCGAGCGAESCSSHNHHHGSWGSQRSNTRPEPWGVRQHSFRQSAQKQKQAEPVPEEETNFAVYRIGNESDILQMRATSFAFRRYQPHNNNGAPQTELEFLESSSYPRGKSSFSCS